MMLIPHSAALDLEGRPYVTYVIILLCLIIYQFQSTNQQEIKEHSQIFCASIYDENLNDDALDIMRTEEYICRDILSYFIYDVEHVLPDKLKKWRPYNYATYRPNMDEMMALMKTHYKQYNINAPVSLNKNLMYYPDSWNPWRSITSALSHSSFTHILFNLIFFFAFAPSLELLIKNKLKFIGVMITIALITDISYSISNLFGGDWLPSLGLSGVVMGMIGLAAFMMPKARIRVLFWYFFNAFNIFIPVWILAIWYIGLDAWTMLTSSDYGGINLVAHVSGGVAGYLIGYHFFKKAREDAQDDLDEEIEYQRAKREDRFTAYNVSYRGNQQHMENKLREKQARKDYENHFAQLYQYVDTRQDSDAIVLMLENYDFLRVHAEIYEEQFDRIKEWRESRTLLCMGRVCISLLLEQRLYERALVIAEQCQAVTKDFVLADPGEVLLLAWGANEFQMHKVAYYLVHDAERRYGDYIDLTKCQLMEAELLWRYLEKPDEARKLLNSLLTDTNNSYKDEIQALAESMNP